MQNLKLFLKKRSVFIILLIIFSVGVFLRVYNLETLTHPINPEESVTAVDAYLNEKETDKANTQSRYLTVLLSLSFSIFGFSLFSIKIVSAIIGSITILLTYTATKQLLLFAQHNPYSRTRLHFSETAIEISALLSAGFLASNILHIIISRSAYDAVFAPFFLMLVISTTFYAIRKQDNAGFLLSGLLWGVGCYASSLFIIALPLCIGILLAIVASHRLKLRNKRLKLIHRSMIENERNNILILCIALMATLSSLLVKGFSFFTPNETTFIGEANILNSILANIKEMVNILFINGTNATPFETLQSPIISSPLIPLFIFGIFYIIWTLYYAVYHKNNTLIISQATLISAILIIAMPILFVSSISLNRFVLIVPFICIVSSYGVLMIVRLIAPNKNKRKKVWIPTFAVSLIFIAGLFFVQYNLYFMKIPEQTHIIANTEKIISIDAFIKDQEKNTNIYILLNSNSKPKVIYPKNKRVNNTAPLSHYGYNILLLESISKDFPKNINYISEKEIPRPISSPAIIISLEKNKVLDTIIKQKYPLVVKGEQENFWTYTI